MQGLLPVVQMYMIMFAVHSFITMCDNPLIPNVGTAMCRAMCHLVSQYLTVRQSNDHMCVTAMCRFKPLPTWQWRPMWHEPTLCRSHVGSSNCQWGRRAGHWIQIHCQVHVSSIRCMFAMGKLLNTISRFNFHFTIFLHCTTVSPRIPFCSYDFHSGQRSPFSEEM